MKLKPDTVPSWDGDEDTLSLWMQKVNAIAAMSSDVHRGLGKVVSRRFTGSAETWYYSIPQADRIYFKQNWDTLKSAVTDYWMNAQWLDKQKLCATMSEYREPGYCNEKPSKYVVRKLDLIKTVWDLSDTETIRLVMSNAPSSWISIIQPQLCSTLVQFTWLSIMKTPS